MNFKRHTPFHRRRRRSYSTTRINAEAISASLTRYGATNNTQAILLLLLLLLLLVVVVVGVVVGVVRCVVRLLPPLFPTPIDHPFLVGHDYEHKARCAIYPSNVSVRFISI